MPRFMKRNGKWVYSYMMFRKENQDEAREDHEHAHEQEPGHDHDHDNPTHEDHDHDRNREEHDRVHGAEETAGTATRTGS